MRIGFAGILGSLLLGKLTAAVRYFKIPVVRHLAGAYTELSRNTPLLILLFFLYFGLPKIGLRLEAETCAVAGLIFLGGGYMAEAFRSGYESVDTGQLEAARALGLGEIPIFFRILLPQSLASSFAGLGANLIFLLKETSVFSAVALADLTFVAKDLIGMHYNTAEALLMLSVSYAIILIPLAALITLADRKIRRLDGAF